jgi:uncharacterized membrane protein
VRLGFRNQPHLRWAALCGLAGGGLAALLGRPAPAALLLGWCAGVVLWLSLTVPDMLGAAPEELRRRAAALDEGKWGMLTATLGGALASLIAVAWHLGTAPRPTPIDTVALNLATILLSWIFLHVLFATHYAHEYWIDGRGLSFPGGDAPDFAEFLYVAFTIGMTFEVSDTPTQKPAMRRLVLLHGAVAFLFNAVILAAAVNLAATLT